MHKPQSAGGFHKNPPWDGAATVRPPRLGGNERVGVFASRSPLRPNGLGLSLVNAVARLHKGELRLEDNSPGVRAVIDLGDLCDYLDETGDAIHLQALRRFYEGE